LDNSHKRRIAPPNSYIHVEDFATPKDLVEYLDYLDKNDTAYYQYHEWRNLYPDDRQDRPYRIGLGKTGFKNIDADF